MGTTAQKLQAIQNSKAAIKSAIEAKGVSDVGDVLADYATKIGQISGGGSKYGLTMDNILGDVDANGVLQPPTTGALSSTAIVSIPNNGLQYKFYNGKITSVSLPNMTSIGQYGMQYAFYQDTALTSVSLPNLTTIGSNGLSYAFYQDTALTSVSLPNLTTIGSNGMYMTFWGCTHLDGDIDLSKITTINDTNALKQTFRGCTSIDNVDLSGLTSITAAAGMQYVFFGCTSLKNVYLNKLSTASGSACLGYAFYGCSSLETVNFSEATSVPALSSTDAFGNTNATYKIIVPNALYDQWIAASNWSDSSIKPHIEKAVKGIAFKATSANSTIKLDAVGSPTPISIVYSTDGGATFSTYTIGTTVTLTNMNDTVMFRAGSGVDQVLGNDTSNYYQFTMTGSISVEDTVNFLLNESGSDSSSQSNAYCFYKLFSGCSSLENYPTMPTSTNDVGCYAYMFEDCTGLTVAPQLPYTTLYANCYEGMFKGCTGIETAPNLPATTLANDCYKNLFYGCSSLNKISLAYTGNFSTTYFDNWVYGVAASGQIEYEGTDTTTGASAIPSGWSVVIDYAKKPITFTARQAGSTVGMVNESSAPTLSMQYSTDDGATWNTFTVGSTTVTLANVGDSVCFRGTNTKLGGGTNNSRNRFTFTGQVAVSGNINSLLVSENYDQLLDLTNPSRGERILQFLFYGDTQLVDAENLVLPATRLPGYAYNDMFNGCTNLEKAPKELPATYGTNSNWIYSGMFKYCAITKAPYIRITNPPSQMLSEMFLGCSNLNEIKLDYTGSFGTGSFNNWMSGVQTTSGTFYYNGSTTTRGASYIPSNWTITRF